MSFVKVMIHAVWGTKSHFPFLKEEVKKKTIFHIKENAYNKQIFIDRLNGHTEHLHCLFGLNTEITIAKTLQLLIGESAHWVNRQLLCKSKFEWADEYYAVSVSESQLDKVRAYIDGQEEHHKKVTFLQECEEFIRKYQFKNHG